MVPNSPAELAGLVPNVDFLLGTAETVFRGRWVWHFQLAFINSFELYSFRPLTPSLHVLNLIALTQTLTRSRRC